MAKNLTVKKGQCINFGNCPKANAREVIEVNLGDDFICPECEGGLMEIIPKPGFPPVLKWVLIIVGVLAALVGGYLALKKTAADQPVETAGDGVEQAADQPVTADSIKFDKSVLLFERTGERIQLILTLLPDSVVIKDAIWQSDNEAVAKVDSTGVVTAVSAGKANISARTHSGISASCEVEVVIKDDSSSSSSSNSGKVATPSSTAKPVSVPGGTYTGETKKGKPHGMGRITYTSRTVIREKPKESVAEAGYSLSGEFSEGRLVQGKLFDKAGNQIETIIIGGGAHHK
jgi:hypothetical protein